MKLLPAFSLLLAACATVADADQRYTALGTEPFWSIAIEGGSLTYEAPDGRLRVPAPAPLATGEGRRYQTDRVRLDIVPWVCSDGMSDNLYADTVTAVVDGRTLYGCGGSVVPEDALVNSSWTIERIGDVDVWQLDEPAAYRLAFRVDRVIGRAGCNGFSGPYSRAGDTLTFAPLATTRMACPEPKMEHERLALRGLQGPVRIAWRGAELVLTGSRGTLTLQRSFHGPYAVTPVNPWEPGSR